MNRHIFKTFLKTKSKTQQQTSMTFSNHKSYHTKKTHFVHCQGTVIMHVSIDLCMHIDAQLCTGTQNIHTACTNLYHKRCTSLHAWHVLCSHYFCCTLLASSGSTDWPCPRRPATRCATMLNFHGPWYFKVCLKCGLPPLKKWSITVVNGKQTTSNNVVHGSWLMTGG